MAAQIASTALPPNHSSPPVPPVFPMAHPDFIHAFNRSVGQLDLSDGSVRLLELLLSYDLPDPKNGQQRKEFIWPSRATLAEELNVTERTVSKRLSELRNAGIIEDMTGGEIAHLRRQGFDVPGPGRGSVWRIHYNKLPDFQLSEEAGFYPGEKGASPPYTESGKPNGPTQHHQESKDVATVLSIADDDGGDASSPSPPETEPSIPRSEESKELQTDLLKWKVSKPIVDRIVASVAPETVQWALALLDRNQVLPRDGRVIVNPPAWLCYVLTVLDDPNLAEWERRIAAMEEESIAPAPTSWTVQIEELLPKEQEPPPPTVPAPIETPPVEATVAPAALEVEIQEEAPADIAQAIEASFAEAEGAAPVFDVQVGTEDQPGTTASFFAGVKTIELRYGSLEIPPEHEMNIIDERTMPTPEPVPEGTEEDRVEEVETMEEVSLSHEETNETCSDENGHIGEETLPPSAQSDQPVDEMLIPTQPHRPWHLNQADCDKLWQEIQAQLEGEQQHLPLLDQVTLRWKDDHVELQSPERAISWALENRADLIQSYLRRLTGRALRVEVQAKGRWK